MAYKDQHVHSVSMFVNDPQAVPPDKRPGTNNTGRYPNFTTAYVNKKPMMTVQPTIPESDSDEENKEKKRDLDNNSLRISFTKNNPVRTSGTSSLRAKILEARAYENHAYQDHENHFQRGAVNSAMSSRQSLPIQREQYCCFTRWSPFERKLGLMIGVLASVIVGMTVVIGVLAKSDDNKVADEGAFWTL